MKINSKFLQESGITTEKQLLVRAAKTLDDKLGGYTYAGLESHGKWNPITDNGDAFKLAVELNVLGDCIRYVDLDLVQVDKCAAYRQAITITAAVMYFVGKLS